MNRYFKIILVAILAMFIVAGCGKKEEANDNALSSSLKINSDGTLVLVLKGNFDKDYYKEDELLSMVSEEIAEFNSVNGENKIKIGNHSVNGSDVTLELVFSDVDSYNKYMPHDAIYFGTIKDAESQGYDFNRSLNVAGKKNATIGKNDLMKMSDSNVVIVKTPYKIETPGKVTYYSQGMNYDSANTVSVSTNGVYFVMYK